MDCVRTANSLISTDDTGVCIDEKAHVVFSGSEVWFSEMEGWAISVRR
jgi:hypothetical protein